MKAYTQDAEDWYRSCRWNRISRSYLSNALTEFIITIREQDGRVFLYWFLPRNTYTYCLPRLCMLNLCLNNTTDYVMLQLSMLNLCLNNTTDYVMLQRILWLPYVIAFKGFCVPRLQSDCQLGISGMTWPKLVTELVRTREREILLTRIVFNFDVHIREFLCSYESQKWRHTYTIYVLYNTRITCHESSPRHHSRDRF